jgi:hypothetical protein
MLVNDYTIFYKDQSVSMIQNQLIDNMSDSKHSLWWGNILVLKHDAKSSLVVNMKNEDIALVDHLIAW